jgi:hypothetical protein
LATLEIPQLTDLHCQSVIVRSGYLLTKSEYDELLSALPADPKRSKSVGARGYVRRVLKRENENYVLMDEVFRVHGLAEHQEEELSDERTLSPSPHAAHLHMTVGLYSVSIDYRENTEAESLLDAAWQWINLQGGLEVDVSAAISVPTTDYEPLIPLNQIAVESLGVFSEISSIGLVKYQDETSGSPLLYQVEYRQPKDTIELRTSFKALFSGASDDALKLSSRARELASFALKPRSSKG